jgi:glycerophosphoryl diester phosphodiesterase
MTGTLPRRIAHRGHHQKFPENSMEAFRSAFEVGADGIEFDVHLNNDGVPVVVHNYLSARTQMHPTLDEVLAEFGQRGRMEIEIKSLDPRTPELVRSLTEKYQVSDLEVTSSIVPLIPKIREAFPDAEVGMIFRPWLVEDWMPMEFRIEWILAHLQLTGATALNTDLSIYSPEIVQALHDNKMTAHTHLFKADPADWQKLKDWGIDFCTCEEMEILNFT